MSVNTLSAVPKPKMVMRSLRVPEKLWNKAKDKADREQSDISTKVRELLEQYVQGDE